MMRLFLKISYAFFWIILMALAGWATFYAVMNQPDISPEDRQVTKPQNKIGAIIARTPRLEEIGPDGKVRWHIESEGMTGDIEGAFHMTNVQAVISLENKGIIVLTAPEGDYDRPANRLVLKGGVKAVNESDQTSFWASEVEWNGVDRILKSAKGDVKLNRKNLDIHASSITVDLSGIETKIDLDEPVHIEGYR